MIIITTATSYLRTAGIVSRKLWWLGLKVFDPQRPGANILVTSHRRRRPGCEAKDRGIHVHFANGVLLPMEYDPLARHRSCPPADTSIM
jgi:hypothetical protein